MEAANLEASKKEVESAEGSVGVDMNAVAAKLVGGKLYFIS